MVFVCLEIWDVELLGHKTVNCSSILQQDAKRLLFIECLPYFQAILQSNFTTSKEVLRNFYVKQKSYLYGLSSKFFLFFFLDVVLYATINKINGVIRDISSVLIQNFWVASGV